MSAPETRLKRVFLCECANGGIRQRVAKNIPHGFLQEKLASEGVSWYTQILYEKFGETDFIINGW